LVDSIEFLPSRVCSEFDVVLVSFVSVCSDCVRDNGNRRVCSTLVNDGDDAVVVAELADNKRLVAGVGWRFGPEIRAARPWIETNTVDRQNKNTNQLYSAAYEIVFLFTIIFQ